MSGIFISYRRSVSQHFARSIFSELRERGHDVFLDVNSIDSGAFDNIIRNQIAAHPHFLLLLSKGSLERCANEGDWLLEEIQEAVRLKRNIVPVYDDGFKFDDEKHFLPESLQKFLSLQNAPPYSHYYFKAFIDALSDRFFKDKVDNLPVIATPPAERAEVQKRIEQAAQSKDDKTSQFEYELVPPTPSHPQMWGVENILPQPFEWVYIPEGNVTIGSLVYYVNSFNIAKYPITNAQFEVFVHAKDGYRNLDWWNNIVDSREWRSQNSRIPFPAKLLGSDRAAEFISWYDALAFCNWLTNRFNSHTPELPPIKIILPTEQQWLRAARGDSNHNYPWGEKFDQTCCNTSESRIRHITPVTQYPRGVSPYGVMDMVGNIYEMFLDNYKIKFSDNIYSVIRGGSWKTDSSQANLNYKKKYQG